MTEKKRKGARVKFFPPYALMFGLLISSLIEVFICPMPFMGNGSYLFLILGITITLASFVLAIFTLTIFTANDQNPHPKAVQNELFVGGSFRFSRNPIYLAIIIILLSCGLAFNSIWYIVSAVISYFLINYLVIIPEEIYLEKEFGKVYLDYKKSVRRWL